MKDPSINYLLMTNNLFFYVMIDLYMLFNFICYVHTLVVCLLYVVIIICLFVSFCCVAVYKSCMSIVCMSLWILFYVIVCHICVMLLFEKSDMT